MHEETNRTREKQEILEPADYEAVPGLKIGYVSTKMLPKMFSKILPAILAAEESGDKNMIEVFKDEEVVSCMVDVCRESVQKGNPHMTEEEVEVLISEHFLGLVFQVLHHNLPSDKKKSKMEMLKRRG